MMTKIRTKISLIALLLVIIVGVIFLDKNSSDFGTVNIQFDLPSTYDLNAKVNGKIIHLTGLKDTYKLPAGQYTLEATKTYYIPFTASFKLDKGQSIFINVDMKSIAPQSTTTANSQLEESLNGYLPQGFSIQSAEYFYNNTWVVANIETMGSDQAILVAQYVGGVKPWEVILSPGTLFSPQQISGLPNDISEYLNQQGFVLNGSTL